MAQPIRDRLVGQLLRKGMLAPQANAIATATLQKAGDLKKGSTKMTAKGKQRSQMGADGRAKDRAAKASGSGHKASDYTYSSKTNRATLKNKK